MTKLGAVSSKVHSESDIILKLSDAIMNLEIESIGKSSELNISDKDIKESRSFVKDFALRLFSTLECETQSSELTIIVNRFRTDMKPIEDWKEDIKLLIKNIDLDDINEMIIVILENILSILDDEFSNDIKSLYYS